MATVHRTVSISLWDTMAPGARFAIENENRNVGGAPRPSLFPPQFGKM